MILLLIPMNIIIFVINMEESHYLDIIIMGREIERKISVYGISKEKVNFVR